VDGLEGRSVSVIRLRSHGRTEEVRLEGGGAASIGARSVAYRRTAEGADVARIEIDGRAHRVVVGRDGERLLVWCDGVVHEFEPVKARAAGAADHGSGLSAPMPGRVRRLFVRAGASVSAGEPLLALEAMKMEHTIRAPRAGVVERVFVSEGDLVDAGAELVSLETAAP
jgi:3-methylcrotonyl-CoA carboxylase alpha subunit